MYIIRHFEMKVNHMYIKKDAIEKIAPFFFLPLISVHRINLRKVWLR